MLASVIYISFYLSLFCLIDYYFIDFVICIYVKKKEIWWPLALLLEARALLLLLFMKDLPQRFRKMVSRTHLFQGSRKQFCIGWAERSGAGGGGSGGSSSPHPLDLNARNLFLNSADMQRWQNTEQSSCQYEFHKALRFTNFK